MWKWISWVVRMGATALLLSFLCIWTTGYIVNSYMETLIKQLELPIETRPFALSGVWGTLWGADAPVKEAAPSETKTENHTGGAGTATQETGTVNSHSPEASPSGAPSPSSEASPEPSTGNDDSQPVYNGESGSVQLSDSERQELYAMVVSKLNPEELKQLSDSLKDGLTEQELADVDKMLKKSLSEKEYEQMMTLLRGTLKPDLSAPTEG